ncbi:unnamed protein product, partial [Rotaria sp. Silwood2]
MDRLIEYTQAMSNFDSVYNASPNLNIERQHLLEQMEEHVKKQRKSLVNYIIHCVIDQIPVEPHP